MMNNSMASIRDLPDHVMEEIFSYLTLQQLKQASLTCTAWFHLAHQRSLQKKYVTTFYGDLVSGNKEFLNPKAPFESFFKLKYPSSNLALQDCDISYTNQKDLWTSHGKKITSLKLATCMVKPDDLAGIIRSCRNLQALEFDGSIPWNAPSSAKLDGVQLTKLSFKGKGKWVSPDGLLNAISPITARLGKLAFRGMQFPRTNEEPMNRPGFKAFYDFLELFAPTLKELDLSYTPLEDSQLHAVFALESLELSCLRLTLKSSRSNAKEVILSIARSQEHCLKELKLDLTTELFENTDNAVLLSLHQLKMLEVLKLKMSKMCIYKITGLAHSVIVGLPLIKRFILNNRAAYSAGPQHSVSNELGYDFSQIIPPIGPLSNLFREYFGLNGPAITVLKFQRFDAPTTLIRNMWQFLPCLEVLSMKRIIAADRSFTDCKCHWRKAPCQNSDNGTSVRSLKRLKTLELCSLSIHNHTFGALQFPHLAELKLSDLRNIKANVFSIIGQQNPCLEFITLENLDCFNEVSQLADLLKPCPNLLTLRLKNRRNWAVNSCDLVATVKEFGPTVRTMFVSGPNPTVKTKEFRFF